MPVGTQVQGHVDSEPRLKVTLQALSSLFPTTRVLPRGAVRTRPLPPWLCQVPFCKRMREKLRDVKKLARGHTAGSAGAEVEGGFPDSSSAVAVSAAAACVGRPALPLRSPSSLLAVRLLQGSPGRPDHRCRPRSLVGVARPAPTSPPSRNHVTAGSRACSQTGSRRQRSARGREPPLKRRRAGWPCSFSGSVALPTVRQKLTAQTWKSQEGPQTSVRRGPTSREKWAAVILLSNWA